MTLMICVDDRQGMAFNRRRQSRDSAVCRDMLALAEGLPIHMNPRSEKLFQGMEGDFRPAENFAEAVGEGEFCFLELQPAGDLATRAKRLILYRWNRHYPADLYFEIPGEGWRLDEITEFPGTSHENITREVYVREED